LIINNLLIVYRIGSQIELEIKIKPDVEKSALVVSKANEIIAIRNQETAIRQQIIATINAGSSINHQSINGNFFFIKYLI
jgi:hypothetical protein